MSLSRLWRVVRTDPRRIVTADREVMVAVLRREAGLALAPVTRGGRTAMVTLSGLVDRGIMAEATYARVLDGHTLNLHVSLPEPADEAELLFVRRRARERAPVLLRSGGGSAEATVLLGSAVGGVPLAPGRWRILLWLRLRDGRERTLALRLTDPGRGGDDGPTLAAPPCPRTGYRHQVGFSPVGALTLSVTLPEPTAELTRLSIHASGLHVLGRLLGVDDATGTTIVFASDRREHRVPARLDGTVFDAAVPVREMADGPVERPWKVWAEVPAAGRLRIGRFLTDLRSPQAVHRRPNRMIRLDGTSFAMVRPSYAGGGGLTLVCAAGEAFTPKDEQI